MVLDAVSVGKKGRPTHVRLQAERATQTRPPVRLPGAETAVTEARVRRTPGGGPGAPGGALERGPGGRAGRTVPKHPPLELRRGAAGHTGSERDNWRVGRSTESQRSACSLAWPGPADGALAGHVDRRDFGHADGCRDFELHGRGHEW